MKYVFKDRDDLEEVQGLKDKLEACVDMINTYALKFGYQLEDLQPDKVAISTGVNARDLRCIIYKNDQMFYVLDVCQMYGFGGAFYCKADLHQAAELAMVHVKEAAELANKRAQSSKKVKQTIKLGGA